MKRQTRAYRFETLHHNRDRVLSLMPLNTMLAQAQKELPPGLAPQLENAGDELAMQLLTKVKRQFKCSTPAHWIGSPIPFGLEEMAGPDV